MTTKAMGKAFFIIAALGLSATHGEEGQQAQGTFKLGLGATDLISMEVSKLRDASCGGE